MFPHGCRSRFRDWGTTQVRVDDDSSSIHDDVRSLIIKSAQVSKNGVNYSIRRERVTRENGLARTFLLLSSYGNDD